MARATIYATDIKWREQEPNDKQSRQFNPKTQNNQ